MTLTQFEPGMSRLGSWWCNTMPRATRRWFDDDTVSSHLTFRTCVMFPQSYFIYFETSP